MIFHYYCCHCMAMMMMVERKTREEISKMLGIVFAKKML